LLNSRSLAMIPVPDIIEIGGKSCIAPVAFRVSMMAPLTLPLYPATAQSPDKCKVRAMPAAATISEEDNRYDVTNLPHGNEVYEVL